MTTTNNEIAALATTLVDAATQKQLTLRVLGGVAVYLTCPSIAVHPTLQRTWLDLDFAAPREQWDALTEVFTAHEAKLRAKKTASWVFEHTAIEIELCDPMFAHNDLSPRLALTSSTLPLADLLLVKLQRTQFEEKDLQDAMALLLDHAVASGNAGNQIDHAYIAKLCARNWNLFHAVYDNTVMLEKALDKYLVPEEAQRVWQRIETIQGEMDQQPKSFGWMVNQFLRKPTQVPR
jgi:hypothetical protein